MSTVVQQAPSGRTMLRNMCWVQRPDDRNTAHEQAKVCARARVCGRCIVSRVDRSILSVRCLRCDRLVLVGGHDLEMLTAWHTAVVAAPREHVKLAPGEALIIDNYRMFHGRTAYGKGAEHRQLWRQWVWTTDAKNVPLHNGRVGAVTSTPYVKELNDEEGHALVPVVAAQASKL